MAGAGKKRQQEARKASHKTEDPSQIESSEQGNDQEHKFAGGYDGPADAPSDAGSRSNPFGPGLGFDPAKPQTTNSDVPRNLELPAAAYATTDFAMEPQNFRYYDRNTDTVKNEIPNNLPLRPKDMNTTGKAVTVRVNQFKVVKWPQKTVYQYDVLIGSGNEKRGLIKAVWHSQAIQAALKQVGPMWLFDGQRIAWCSAKAPRGELRIMVDLDKEKGKLPRKDSNGNNLDNRVRVAVKASAEINMAVISGYLERKMAFDNSILEAIST
ncbi:MAG: hypothetical protein M1818_000673 [Claussenomyces sp. TS43310]|nr:MAG: hypothetical protein M1818_000673 [Claussenomyces sp. TS43310]